MKNNLKTKTTYIEFITKALSDGKPRKAVLATTLSKYNETIVEEKDDYVTRKDGSERIIRIISREIAVQEVSIGLAITSPADTDKHNVEEGEKIALGKSLKSKSSIITVKSEKINFNGQILSDLTDVIAKAVVNSPGKFVTISKVKTPVKTPVGEETISE